MELLLLMVAVLCAGGYFTLRFTAAGPSLTKAAPQIAAAVGLPPDKMGWMDDAEFTAADRQRVAAITGRSEDSNLSVIRSIQAGARGSVSRRDFELLRQDRRRARAAYPDVKPNDLTDGGWLTVKMSARIPSSWCTSGNSNGTQGSDGRWYLDGGCYVGFVRAQYTERASAEETSKFFADLKITQSADELSRLQKDGPFTMWSGTDGSMSVRLDKETGKVVITRAQEWASKGKRWTMPFVPEEWVGVYASRLEDIKKLPSFAQAVGEEIAVTPSGVTITMGGSTFRGGNARGMVLMPGQSMDVSTSWPNK